MDTAVEKLFQMSRRSHLPALGVDLEDSVLHTVLGHVSLLGAQQPLCKDYQRRISHLIEGLYAPLHKLSVNILLLMVIGKHVAKLLLLFSIFYFFLKKNFFFEGTFKVYLR